MSFCAFAGSNAMFGTTPVENMFILEYMPGASGDFVRVYLYGLMLCHHPEMDEGIEGMARALRVDSETVLNAFRYWEREGLVSRLSDNPPTYEYIPLSRAQPTGEPMDEVYKYKNFNRELQNALPGLMLDSHEIRIANEWIDVMHLPEDVVLMMVKSEAAKRGKKLPAPRTLFRHLDDTAKIWAEAGIQSIDAAEEYLKRTGAAAQCANQVLRQFGLSRAATKDEIKLAEKWLESWQLPPEIIIESCAETVKSASPSFGYLDKILSSRVNGAEADHAHRENVKKLIAHLGIASRPTEAQLAAYRHFVEMGFDFGAIEQAAILCGENNKRTFEDIQRKLEQWEKMRVFTLEEIEEERRIQKQYTDIAVSIFERCGIDKRVQSSDIKQIRVWTALIELDAVLFAAECANGAEAPMKYINKLIVSWSAKGVKTLEAAKQEYAQHRLEVPPKPEAKPAYAQRDVKDEEFAQGFYVDVMNRKGAEHP